MEEAKQPNPHELKQQEEKRVWDELEAETAAWLANNPKVQEYLNGFKAHDVQYFKQAYPRLKAQFMQYGASLGDLPQQLQESYIQCAADRLMDIQRKKLFNLMCRWDARLIDLESIKISNDFLKWDHDMENCPLISPISQEEFDLYMEFVQTGEFEKDSEISIGHYDYYRDKEETYEDRPAWFKFEEHHTGHDSYLNLPMLRSAKEDEYRKRWSKERDRKTEIMYETGEAKRFVPDERPELTTYYYAHLEQFIIHNESKEVLHLFRKHYDYFHDELIRDNEEDEENSRLTQRAESIIHSLSGIKDKIAVEASDDWREALIDGFETYERNQVLHALPYAYSDYTMRKQLGITISKEDNDRRQFDMQLIDMVRDQILCGRELNGEPRDLEF